jgi:hypothetical protein
MENLLKTFPEILKYGATGLSALLFFFAYLLLKQQSHKEKPDKSVLQTIKSFMYISVALVIISLISTAIEAKLKGSWRISSTIELQDKEGNKIDVVPTTDEKGNTTTEDLRTFLGKHLKIFIEPDRDIIGKENVHLSIPKYDEITTITYSIDGFISDEKTLKKDDIIEIDRISNTIDIGKMVLKQTSKYVPKENFFNRANPVSSQPGINQ